MSKYSYVMTQGHQKSHVLLDEALKEYSPGGSGQGVEKVDTLPEQGEEGKIYYNTTDGNYYRYVTDGENGAYLPLGIKYVENIDMDEKIERGTLYYDPTSDAYYITNQNSQDYPVELGRIEFINDYQGTREGGVIYYDPDMKAFCANIKDKNGDEVYYRFGNHPIYPISVDESSNGTINVRANTLYISTFAGTHVGQTVAKILSIQLQDGPNGPYIIRFTAFSGIQVLISCADNSTIYFSGEVPDYESGHTYEINILGSYANIYDVTPGDPTVPVVEGGGGR